MSNQKPPVIDAVQDRYAEKIILSGSPFISAIFGHGAYGITAAAIPVFLRDPIITGETIMGDPTAPTTLTCEAQSFSSSPRAVLTYQWKRDTVNITDETSITYTTVLGDVGTEITCEATATNGSGSDIEISNGITVIALVPSEIFQLDIMPIQGLANLERIDVMSATITVVSGMTHVEKIDTNDLSLFAMTGWASIDSIDVNDNHAMAITGFASLEAAVVSNNDVMVIQGFVSLESIMVFENEAYAMFLPTLLTPLVVVNGDAELVSMAAWTMDTNTVTSETSAPGSSVTNREGLRFFVPEQLGQGVDSQMHQVIVIPGGDLTDIDTGLCYCVVRFIHMSDEGFDKLVITLEALNAADGVLATKVYSPAAGPTDRWLVDSNSDDPLSVPTLTRKVRITVLFDAHASSGTAVNSVYADDFQIELMKTA